MKQQTNHVPDVRKKDVTAIDYLIEQLFPKALSAEQYYHIEQAKAMEEQRIIDIDMELAKIENIAHGEVGNAITELRKKLQ